MRHTTFLVSVEGNSALLGDSKDLISLELRRAPHLLRLVGKGGEWDALDQIDDTAAPDERILVAVKLAGEGTVHIDGVNAKTGRRFGKWMTSVHYRLVKDQPADAEVRSNADWQRWAMAEARRIREEADRAVSNP